MNRLLTLALIAAPALVPGIASAGVVVADPQLEAETQQVLAVEKQQLTVLDNIQALLQVIESRPQAETALTYAQQQTKAQETELTRTK